MTKRVPWQLVSANIIHRNPAEWHDIVTQRGTAKPRTLKLFYPGNPGGPYTGRVTSRLPLRKGDRFYWTFGLAQVMG